MRYGLVMCLALATVLPLTGCSRKQDARSVTAAKPDAASAADGTLPDSAQAGAAPLVISVVSEDGDPLDADILVVREPGKFDPFTHVDRPGPKALDAPCEANERFQARPVIEDFRQGSLVNCSPHLNFVMYSILRTFNIRREGQAALDGGNFLLAQERLGLAADRYEFSQPVEAQRLRLMSVAAAGRLLGVSRPIETQGAHQAPSEELQQRLRTFQIDHNLEATGELDAETRGAISRMQLRGADVIVPPTAEFQQVEAPLADPRATVPASEAATSAVAMAAAAEVQAQPDVRTSVGEVMVQPASPENAAIIRSNRARFNQKGAIQQPAQ